VGLKAESKKLREFRITRVLSRQKDDTTGAEEISQRETGMRRMEISKKLIPEIRRSILKGTVSYF